MYDESFSSFSYLKRFKISIYDMSYLTSYYVTEYKIFGNFFLRKSILKNRKHFSKIFYLNIKTAKRLKNKFKVQDI